MKAALWYKSGDIRIEDIQMTYILYNICTHPPLYERSSKHHLDTESGRAITPC